MANPYDEEAREKTQAIIEDCLATVGVEYPKSFAKMEIKALKKNLSAEENGPDAEEIRMLEYPSGEEEVDESDIQSGFLTKLGGIRKNWKKRWFVIDHTYTVRYFASEAAASNPKKAKGEFTGTGYSVVADKEDATLIRLEAYYESDLAKRVYQFKVENAEDRTKWVTAFKGACCNAPNPMHKDPARAGAFADMWLALEAKQGYHWSEMYVSGSEQDMLAYHLFQRVDHEILRDVFSNISGGDFLVKKITNTIRSTVGKTIGTAVDGAWKAVSAGVDAAQDTVKAKIKDGYAPIAKTEADVKAKAEGGVNGAISPILSGLLGPIKELMQLLLTPLTLMYKGVIELFCKTPELLSKGMLGGILEGVDFQAILDAAMKLLPNLGTLGNIIAMVVESCGGLLTRASWHYNKKDGKNLAITGRKLLFDMLREIRNMVRFFVETLVSNPMSEKLGEIIEAAAAPLEELIPDAVKEFLSPTDFCQEIADSVIGEQVEAVVDAATESVTGDLESFYQDKCGTEVKIPSAEEGLSYGATVGAPAAAADEAPTTERRSTVVVAEDVDSDGEGEGDEKE